MNLPLKIQFRPLLRSGMLMQSKRDWLILIDTDQPESEQAIALWHEIIHVLELASGNASPEEAVEMLAKTWAEKCPGILELCRPLREK